MIDVVVLLEVKDYKLFREFESAAIDIMKKYGGVLQNAFTPDKETSNIPNVDEVHQLKFPSIDAFKSYREDPKLKELYQLRTKAITNTMILVSGKVIIY